MYADSGEDFAKPAKFLSVTNRRRILVGICVMLSIGILGVAVGSIVAVTFYECDKVPFTEIHLYSIDASQVEELLVSMPPIRDSYLELEEDPTLSAIIVNATRISSRKTYLDDFSETVPTNGDIGFHFSGIASYILGCPKYNVSIRTPSRIYSKVRLKSINSHYIVNGIQSRQLYMQSTAGGITVRNFAVEELFATTAKGKVEVSEGSSLRFANLSSQLTGDVRLQNFVSPEIRAKALNGRIVVTNVSCSDSANLITSRGQIDVFSVFMKDHQSMLSTSNEISGKVRVDIFPEEIGRAHV